MNTIKQKLEWRDQEFYKSLVVQYGRKRADRMIKLLSMERKIMYITFFIVMILAGLFMILISSSLLFSQ